MTEQQIKEIRYEVLASTPRRWGKTYSVAMFVLALMLAVPGIRVCVFSTGKRASTSLMEIIKLFMSAPEMAQYNLHARCVKTNQEELYIVEEGAGLAADQTANGSQAKTAQADGRTSRLYCYPSSVTGQWNRDDNNSD